MRLKNQWVAALHLALTLAGLVALLACAHDRKSAELVERYTPVLVDAGLGWGLGRIGDLSIRVHPGSDGGSWTPPQPIANGTLPDGGTRWLTTLRGYAGEGCYSYPGERVIWVSSLESPVVCHELAHVARSDIYSESVGECIGPGDHDYFESVGLDRKCAEVAAQLQQITTGASDAER